MPAGSSDVINFGILPSLDLAGALAKGQEAKTNRKAVDMQRNQYALELARMDHDKKEEDYQHWQKTLDHLGAYKDNDPQGYAIFMNSEHGKELIKKGKQIDPDSINDDSDTKPQDKIIAPHPTKIYQMAIEKHKAAIAADPNLDPRVKQAAANHNSADGARILYAATKDPKWLSAGPDGQKALVKQYTDLFNQSKQSAGGQNIQTPPAGSTPSPTASALAPQGSDQSKDPLGILSNATNN